MMTIYDYYPFGLQFNSWARSTNKENKFLYNGKEIEDELDLGWYAYGQRNYDATIGRFFNVDRFSELYTGLSVYQYTANNPIRFTDINGDYIEVYDKENSLRLIYENGKTYFSAYDDNGNITKGDEYDGEGTDFTNVAISSLDKMGSTENGREVLGELESSENSFSFQNIESKGTLSFAANDEGGGVIKAAALLSESLTEGQKVESVAHELFHGYQYEKGQNILSTNNEVGAYLFGAGVSISAGYFTIGGFGNSTEQGRIYSSNMSSLLYGDVFDLLKYKEAAKSFRKGSNANREGIYNGFPDYIHLDKFQNPVIKDFYPLLK